MTRTLSGKHDFCVKHALVHSKRVFSYAEFQEGRHWTVVWRPRKRSTDRAFITVDVWFLEKIHVHPSPLSKDRKAFEDFIQFIRKTI